MTDKTLPTLNIELIEKTLKWIEFTAGTEGHPAWRQRSWARLIRGEEAKKLFAENNANMPEDFCGTAFCAAGYALSETGNLRRLRHGGLALAETIHNALGEKLVLKGPFDYGYYSTWEVAGAHVFGMTLPEADDFFDEDNTLAVLKKLAREYAEKRGATIYIEDSSGR